MWFDVRLDPRVRLYKEWIALSNGNPYPADKVGAFLILIGQRANFIHSIGIYPLDKVIYCSYNRTQVVILRCSRACAADVLCYRWFQLRERLALLKVAEKEEEEKKRDDILKAKVVS